MNKVKEVALKMFSKEEAAEYFGLLIPEENVVEQKFVEIPLADDAGMIYTPGDELTVGSPVFEADQETPLADGEYTLEDGVMIVVADGAVADLQNPNAEAEEEAPADEEVVEEAAAISYEEIFESLAPAFEKYDSAIAGLEAELAEIKSLLTENNNKVEKMSKIASTTHSETKSEEAPKQFQFSSQRQMAGAEKLKSRRLKS